MANRCTPLQKRMAQMQSVAQNTPRQPELARPVKPTWLQFMHETSIDAPFAVVIGVFEEVAKAAGACECCNIAVKYMKGGPFTVLAHLNGREFLRQEINEATEDLRVALNGAVFAKGDVLTVELDISDSLNIEEFSVIFTCRDV